MPINVLFLEILRIFCKGCNAINAGQLHSALWMLVAVLCIQSITYRATKDHLVAFLVAALLLTSQMAWVFAMQPQAYSPLMGTLALLLWTLFSTRSGEYSVKWSMRIAAIYGLAVLYHQAMVLIAPPLGYYLFATKGKDGFRAALTVLLTSGTAVLALYIWAASHVQGTLSIRSFLDYLVYFGQVMADPKYFNFSNYSWSNLWILANSQFNAFQLPVWQMKEGILGTFLAGLLVMLAWNIRQALRKRPYAAERTFLLLVLAIFWALTLWGNPIDDGWPSFILIPLFVLFSLSLADARNWIANNQTRRSILCLALLFFFSIGTVRNLHGRILPMHHEKGAEYASAEAIALATPAECTVFESRMLTYYNLGYYFDRTVRDYWDIITAAYYGSIQQRVTYFGQSAEAPCFVIDSRYLHPSYSVSGKTAFDLPGEWIALIAWIFDIQATPGGGYDWRAFELIEARNGSSYLLIAGGKQNDPQPIASFWNALSVIDKAGDATRSSLARWFEETCVQEGSPRQPLHALSCEVRFAVQEPRDHAGHDHDRPPLGTSAARTPETDLAPEVR